MSKSLGACRCADPGQKSKNRLKEERADQEDVVVDALGDAAHRARHVTSFHFQLHSMRQFKLTLHIHQCNDGHGRILNKHIVRYCQAAPDHAHLRRGIQKKHAAGTLARRADLSVGYEC